MREEWKSSRSLYACGELRRVSFFPSPTERQERNLFSVTKGESPFQVPASHLLSSLLFLPLSSSTIPRSLPVHFLLPPSLISCVDSGATSPPSLMEPAVVSFDRFGRQADQPRHYWQKKSGVQNVGPFLDSKSPSLCAADASSNLRRFLQHTTPRVPAQFLSKTHLRSVGFEELYGCEKGFFSLNDLWESFDEWSAYGAGVPILLDGKQTVMQYYVPYLSGIQLYSSSANGLTIRARRRLGDDSEGSEMDFRDSTSETSSCDGELERLSDHVSSSSSDAGERVHEGETLIFEYFETSAPSLRVPLSDKVKELAEHFRGLKNVCSNDLSQSSWLSVAWYPIYRIPTGPTLKDLGACFLTYHSISTLSTDDLSKLSQTHVWHGAQVTLHPFGLAGYKFRGSVWNSAGVTDRQYANLLHRSSDEWLKRLYVHHPDFEYFKSHCTPVHRHA